MAVIASRPARFVLAAFAGAVAVAFGGPVGGTVVRAAGPTRDEPAGPPPAAAQPAPGADPRLVWHGSRADRVVALTFDDGYAPANVRRIFETLSRERVPATFFVTGVYVQRAPALWRRIAAAGYPIANHSYLHRDTTTLTPAQVARDLARTRAAIEAVIGRPMLDAFRPPYGARNAATDRLAAAAGFPTIVMWDVTAGDTVHGATVAGVVASASAGRPGSIVLLHAGPSVTPRALAAIIARYRERGFRFVTLPELLDLLPAVGPATAPAAPAANPGDDRPRDPDLRGAAPGRAAGAADAAASAPDAPPTAAHAVPAALAPPDAQAPASPAPPAVRAAGSSPPPVARDAAWARRAGTPAAVAVATAIGLVLLVLVAAAVGRARPREEDHTG